MSGGAAFAPPLASPLRITGLVKWFGETLALDDLSFAVPAQSCYGLVGPNGSGKSTTLRSVIGLVRPDAGVIEVCGHDIATELREARRTIGVVLDPLQLFERLTAREFLATMGGLRQMDHDVVRERTDELLETLQLADDVDEGVLEATPVAHVGRWSSGDNPSVVDHTDVIAQALDEIHHVTRQHDGAAAGTEAVEHRPHRAGRQGVDALERLVEQQEPRSVQHRRRERGLLAHAVAVAGDLAVGVVGELQRFQQFVGALAHDVVIHLA